METPSSASILIVDDNRIGRLMLRHLMEKEGWTVLEAENGQEGLALFDLQRPDLFLLDIEISDMNGVEFCARLRQRPGGDKIPLLLISGLTDRVLIAQALEAGATDYLTKPIEWRLLRQRISQHLQLQAAETKLAQIEIKQEEFLHYQKTEAIDRMAGTLAHEFNNLLQVINGYSERLLSGLVSDQSGWRHDMEKIKQAGQRAAALNRQLLSLSRRQPADIREISLNDILTDLEDMLRRLISQNIDLEVRLAPDLGWVAADQGQLEQVLMNLVINARDAMPYAGRLTIETGNVFLEKSHTDWQVDLKPGSYVMLAVKDTGVGMDQETMKVIFKPFFTTKKPGKGTGLGLAAVSSIVRRSGGHIWVDSDLGQGTTFKIFLPRSRETDRPSLRILQPSIVSRESATNAASP